MCAGVRCAAKWPGNTADAKSYLPVVERRGRSPGREICVVADRGMVSERTLEAFSKMKPPVHYMWGCECAVARRSARWFSRAARPGRSHPGAPAAKDPAPLKVKEVTVEGRRYIVCLNEEERRKDARDRATILEALREQCAAATRVSLEIKAIAGT